jgi:hypothetical protein
MTENGVYKYLDVSTSHMTWEDVVTEQNRDPSIGVVVATYPEGFIAYVCEESLEQEENITNSLRAILGVARSRGCTLIRVDRDGANIDGLPHYTWR